MYTNQDHNLYSGAPDSGNNNSRKTNFLLIVIIFLVLIIGYFTLAYFLNFWPFDFSQKTSGELFSQVFSKISKIENASYELTFSIATSKRDDGLEALDVDYSEIDNPAYERDAQRFDDLKEIMRELNYRSVGYSESDSEYPETLKNLNVPKKDPLGQPYIYRTIEDGNNYELVFVFESSKSIDLIKKRSSSYYIEPAIDGKRVTFNSDSYYYYYIDPEDMRPAFVNFFENQAEYLSLVPSNFNSSLSLSGVFYRANEKLTDSSFSFNGDMEYEDMILRLAADFKKISDTFYFRLNKIPGIFLAFTGDEISSIKEKWIKIEPSDVIDTYSMFSIFEELENQETTQESSQKTMKQLEVFFEIAQQTNLFLGIDKASEETLDKKRVFHYQLGLNAQNLPEFYTAFTEELEQRFGEDAFFSFDENTLKYLEAPQTTAVVNYFNQNGKFDLFIDANSGYPLKIDYSLVFLSDSDVKTLKDKKLVISSSLSLKNINKGVSIKAPDEFITYDQAAMEMSGKDEDEYYCEKQIDNVLSIRNALGRFYSLANTMPDSLQDLTLSAKEIESKYNISLNEDNWYYTSYENNSLLELIPRDVYDGSDYQYQKWQNDDYRLKYKVILPEYKQGKMPNSNIYSKNYSTGYMSLTSLKYLEGINTADKSLISQEADQVKNIDSDNDQLSDSLEEYLGTNKNKKDTDGDGKNDGYELEHYTDPLGPGALERNYSSLYY